MSRAIHELALPFYDVVDLPRDIALQAPYGLHLGVPLGHLLGDIFLGALIGSEPPYGDVGEEAAGAELRDAQRQRADAGGEAAHPGSRCGRSSRRRTAGRLRRPPPHSRPAR